MRLVLFAALLLPLSIPASGQPIIVTAAGTDLVFTTAGQAASAAALGKVSRVVIDPSGRPVFSDPNYHLVFRVEPDGTIRVIAGNNVQGLTGNLQGGSNAAGGTSGGGYSGDYGPATAAALNGPLGVAYDSTGNLYVADALNHRIRRIDPQGIITTVAGNGQSTFQGDGQPATSASLNFPIDVVVDSSGNIYINDAGNVRIRKVSPQGIITTLAGTGTAGVSSDGVSAASSPIAGDIEGMALDSLGNLYFSEFSNNRVRRISNGLLATVAGTGTAGFNGDGPATQVELQQPGGVAFDAKGNLLISDSGNERIRRLSGGILTTIAGSGQEGFAGDGGVAQAALLRSPFGLAGATTGEIYLADRDNFRIRRIDAQAVISTVAGNGRLLSSQNGVSASLATLLNPFGVSVDSKGLLLVADTDNRILRRMNQDGTISTIAGTGADETSGENGPATQAGLQGPWSVTSDSAGNLYDAEIDGGTVRRIGAANGLISTIAGGTGQAALLAPTQAVTDANGNTYIADLLGNKVIRRAPDGSFTTLSTVFHQPGGLALDSLGNLYVTEWGGGLVRRISPAGNVTTIAGGGKSAGAAADGGPATNAQLGQPAGIVVDSAGNVYFSDYSNSNVRRVAIDGTILTVAGNGSPGFSGDGGPALGASLRGPWGLALDPAGALYIADAVNNRIRKVLLTNSPGFSTDTSSLTFMAASNSKQTDPSPVALSTSLSGLLYTTSADQSWLQATPSSGAMPAVLQISADPTGLSKGTHTANLTVTAAGASPSFRTIAVTFTVGDPAPPALSADVATLGFSFTAGSAPATRVVTIRNLGSGPLSFSSSSAIVNGAGWLTASVSGAAAPNNPGLLTVTVTPGQLAPGTYSGTITLTSAASSAPVNVAVTCVVSASSSKLQLSQNGFTLQTVAGGGAPLPRAFTVLNVGQGSMDWSASVSAGSGWLSISPSSGTVQTPLTDVSQIVSVVANPAGLSPGTYYGKLDVTAGNAFQSVIVTLTVLPAGSSAPPDIYPASLTFVGSQGASPGSQTVSLASLTSQTVTYTSSRMVQSGSPWFVHVPATGAIAPVIAPNQPATVVVQPDFTNLSPGTYQGSITFQFGSSTATVQVVAVVAPSGSTPHLAGANEISRAEPAPRSASCSTLVVNPSTLTDPTATVQLGQPQTLEARVTDNCGSAVTTGSVTVTFSTGDPLVSLAHVGNGRWTGTWTPRSASQSRVTITMTALEGQGTQLLSGSAILTVPLLSSSATPLTVGAVNAASGAGTYISPGGSVSIYGQQLATGSGIGENLPFPTQINGTQVLLGGIALPLRYVGVGQVNAQVPFELTENTQQQLIVAHAGAFSAPQDVLVAPAQPGVYTQDQSGGGPGDIVNGNTNAFITAKSPAHALDVIVIYCNGLGAVSPPIKSGTPSPAQGPASSTVNPVTVTIGGISARVDFAGLQPGSPDLYQVNTIVPVGVLPGNLPVVLTVAGLSSRPVTIAVQ